MKRTLSWAFLGCLVGLAHGRAYTSPPVVYQQPPLDYSMIARSAGAEGVVLIRFLVDEKGTVPQWLVVYYSDPVLASDAIGAVRSWRFHPGTVDGQPQPATMEIPIAFYLDRTNSPQEQRWPSEISDYVEGMIADEFTQATQKAGHPILSTSRAASIAVKIVCGPDGKLGVFALNSADPHLSQTEQYKNSARATERFVSSYLVRSPLSPSLAAFLRRTKGGVVVLPSFSDLTDDKQGP